MKYGLSFATKITVVNFFLLSSATAYIDPGAGSFVIQMLAAAFLGIGFTLKQHFNTVKVYLQKFFHTHEEKSPEKSEIIKTSPEDSQK